MTALEKQLTAALEKLSAQYEMEQRRHVEQVVALRQRVEQQTERTETLQRQVEQLDGQMTRLAECCAMRAGTSRGRWI